MDKNYSLSYTPHEGGRWPLNSPAASAIPSVPCVVCSARRHGRTACGARRVRGGMAQRPRSHGWRFIVATKPHLCLSGGVAAKGEGRSGVKPYDAVKASPAPSGEAFTLSTHRGSRPPRGLPVRRRGCARGRL